MEVRNEYTNKTMQAADSGPTIPDSGSSGRPHAKEIADIVGISESAAGFKQYINSLVISIAWQGASTPIAWRCLDKCRGHSNAPLWQDRCRLF